jgi:signal transduction histidine kinase/FixJ family two-component response regulator
VAIAAVFLALTWFGWYMQNASLGERARADLSASADQVADSFASEVSARLGFIDAIMNFVASFDAANGLKSSINLIRDNRLYSDLETNLIVSDASGHGVFIGPDGTGPVYVGDRPHIRAALNHPTRSLIIGSPLVAKVQHRLSIPFASLVFSRQNRVIGIIATGVPAQTFSAQFNEADIGPNGALAIVDLKRRAILGRFTVTRKLAGGNTIDSHFMQKMLTTKRGAFTQKSAIDGVERAVAFRTLPGFRIAVVAALAVKDAQPKTADQRRNNLIGAFVVSAFIIIGLAVWLRQLIIARRLVMLNHEADEARRDAVAASRAKSDFLAHMSHEIRTPMNGVIGLTHLTLNTNLDAKQRDYLTKINQSAALLLRVINDILDVSKIEAGRIELDEAPFQIDALLEGVSSMAGVQAAQRGIQFRVTRGVAVPSALVGDALRLGQVLTNIVGNAIKFTEHGEVELTVDLVTSAPEATTVRFTVRDTGIGMTETQLLALFEPFGQADTSITRRFGGTGLGLAISKGLVDRMGGRVEVSSQYGAGSTFIIDLPFKPATVTADRPSRTPAGNRQLGGLRLLVAEDNAINQEIIITLLERAGAIVQCVGNGRLVVERIEADPHAFDGILMDVQMPEVDGLAATRAIRQSFDAETMPIIAMTAHALAEERQRCLDAGMNDHVAKPLDPPLLFATILRNCKRPSVSLADVPDANVESALAGELPRFSIRAALERCNGDEAFLRRMLTRFAQLLADAPMTLHDAIARGDTAAAEMLTHNLASMALTVGADGVGSDARALEHAERSGEECGLLLVRLTTSMHEALIDLSVAAAERSA